MFLGAHHHRIVVVQSYLSLSHHCRLIVFLDDVNVDVVIIIVVVVITAVVLHFPIVIVTITTIIVVGVVVVAVAVVIDIIARRRRACRTPWQSIQGIHDVLVVVVVDAVITSVAFHFPIVIVVITAILVVGVIDITVVGVIDIVAPRRHACQASWLSIQGI